MSLEAEYSHARPKPTPIGIKLLLAYGTVESKEALVDIVEVIH